MSADHELRQLVRELRIQRGLNQSQLADKVGVHHNTISGMELGKRGISWATAHALIQVLTGVDMLAAARTACRAERLNAAERELAEAQARVEALRGGVIGGLDR